MPALAPAYQPKEIKAFTGAPTPPSRPRLDSVDLLRGLIMVLMALDHTRDFFTNARFDPLDLTHTNPAYFITRWITHFCAPNFIFLAGVGACLAGLRGKSTRDLSWFLLTRGLWLAILELTWVNWFGWSFSFNIRHSGVGVLWAIGWSMVVLSILVWLPVRTVAVFAIGMIFLHNAFDWVSPDNLGGLGWFWRILHAPGPLHPAAGWEFGVGYVLVPWMGVMAAGYVFGHIFTWNADRRGKWMLGLGLSLTAAFVLIRGINHYGDPRPWVPHEGLLYSAFAFIDCNKYPPSLDYILMTIGPALVLLSFFEKGIPKLLQPFLVFGRVPLFYYLLHLPLIHAMAVAVAYIRHGRADWLFQSIFAPAERPPDAGFGLLGVYSFWILAILILYPVCRSFAEFKARHRYVWLSYL
jgi:uncharacterized membrane protein